MAIVALLASVALPLAELTVQRGKEAELRRSLREIREAIDAYKQASDDGRIARKIGESGYPRKLEELVEGVEDQKSARRERLYFLRRLPTDPFGESWGKRSYASPPDAPAEGADVFDVYSMAPGKGINGRLYKDW